MEIVDITRMSSKGQVVIPGDIRESLGLDTGTKFVVWGDKDTVILKKIGRPSSAEVGRLFTEGSKFARKVGLKKTDIKTAIKYVRQKS